MFSDQSRRDSVFSRLSGSSSQGSPPLAALNMHNQQYQPTMAAHTSQAIVFTDESGRQYTAQQLVAAQHQLRMRLFAQMSPEQKQAFLQQNQRQQQPQPIMAASPVQTQANGGSSLLYTPTQVDPNNQRNAAMGAQRQLLRQQQPQAMSPNQRQQSQIRQHQQQQPSPASSASPPDIYFTASNGRGYTREQFEQRVQRAGPEEQAMYRKMAAQQQQQLPRPATGASPTETFYTDNNSKRYTRAEFEQGLKNLSTKDRAMFREQAEQQQQPKMAEGPPQAQQQQQRPTPAPSPADTYFTDRVDNRYTRAQFEERVTVMPPEQGDWARQQQRLQQRPQPKMDVSPAQAAQQQNQRPTPTASSAEVYISDSSGRSYTQVEFEEKLALMPPERAEKLRQQARQNYQARMAGILTQAKVPAQSSQQQRPTSTASTTQPYFTDGKGRSYTEAAFEQELAKLPEEQAAFYRKRVQQQRQLAASYAQMGPEEQTDLRRQWQQNQEKLRAQSGQARPMLSTMAAQTQAAAKTFGVTKPVASLPQVAGIKRGLPDGEGAYSEGRAPKVAMFAVPTPPSRPSSVQGGAVAKQQKKAAVKKAQVTDIKRRHKNMIPLDQVVSKMSAPAMPASAMLPPAVPASSMSPPAVAASAKRQNKANTSQPMRQSKANTSETIDLTGAEKGSQAMDITGSQQAVMIDSSGSDKSRAIDLTDDGEYEAPQPISASATYLTINAYELDNASLEELGAPTSGEPGVHGLHLYALQNGVKMEDCEYSSFIYNDIMDYSSKLRLHRAMLEGSMQQPMPKKASWMYDGSHATDMVGHKEVVVEVEVEANGVKKEQMSEEQAVLQYEMRMRKGDGPWGADGKGRETWV